MGFVVIEWHAPCDNNIRTHRSTFVPHRTVPRGHRKRLTPRYVCVPARAHGIQRNARLVWEHLPTLRALAPPQVAEPHQLEAQPARHHDERTCQQRRRGRVRRAAACSRRTRDVQDSLYAQRSPREVSPTLTSCKVGWVWRVAWTLGQPALMPDGLPMGTWRRSHVACRLTRTLGSAWRMSDRPPPTPSGAGCAACFLAAGGLPRGAGSLPPARCCTCVARRRRRRRCTGLRRAGGRCAALTAPSRSLHGAQEKWWPAFRKSGRHVRFQKQATRV